MSHVENLDGSIARCGTPADIPDAALLANQQHGYAVWDRVLADPKLAPRGMELAKRLMRGAYDGTDEEQLIASSVATSLGDAELRRRAKAKPDTGTELERLRAIVDRLPKTADGVAITPGMEVWQWILGAPRCLVVSTINTKGYGIGRWMDTGDKDYPIFAGFYSTAEAATVARKGGAA